MELDGKQISLRLTKGMIKKAKAEHGVDLSIINFSNPMASGPMLLINDPIYFLDCFWAFYKDRLQEAGFTEESFDEAVTQENIEELKTTFIEVCGAFFPLVRTQPTKAPESLSGDQISALLERLGRQKTEQ